MNERPPNDDDFTREAFSSLERVEPSASLLRRVAEIPIQHPRAAKRRFWPFETLWQPVLGWALAGTLGLLVGTSGWDESLPSAWNLTSETESAAEVTVASGTDEAGAEVNSGSEDALEEFLALAWGPDTTGQWSLDGGDTSH